MICEKNILQIRLDFEGKKVLQCGGGIAVFVRDNISSLQCAGKNLDICVFPLISYYNSMINGADYVSQDGSPFHDPGTLIKSNKNQSCDHMATHRAHPGGVIPR